MNFVIELLLVMVLVLVLVFLIAIVGERAKRARHYQGCTNSSLCSIYIYICMEVRMP